MNQSDRATLAYVVAQKLLYGSETRETDIDCLRVVEAYESLDRLERSGLVRGRDDPGFVDSYGVYHTTDLRLYSPTLEGLAVLWS